jgi:hypothetical protein
MSFTTIERLRAALEDLRAERDAAVAEAATLSSRRRFWAIG